MTDAEPATGEPIVAELPSEPPLVVLSGHRAGSSMVMRLLDAHGLMLGDVLPPRQDNLYGFFESVQVVQRNTAMLQAMDRDWTCPPTRLAEHAIDRQALVQGADALR